MPSKLVSVVPPSSLNLRLYIQLAVVSPLQMSDMRPDLGVTASAPLQHWPFQNKDPPSTQILAESSKASSLLCPTSYPDPLHHPLG